MPSTARASSDPLRWSSERVAFGMEPVVSSFFPDAQPVSASAAIIRPAVAMICKRIAEPGFRMRMVIVPSSVFPHRRARDGRRNLHSSNNLLTLTEC